MRSADARRGSTCHGTCTAVVPSVRVPSVRVIAPSTSGGVEHGALALAAGPTGEGPLGEGAGVDLERDRQVSGAEGGHRHLAGGLHAHGAGGPVDGIPEARRDGEGLADPLQVPHHHPPGQHLGAGHVDDAVAEADPTGLGPYGHAGGQGPVDADLAAAHPADRGRFEGAVQVAGADAVVGGGDEQGGHVRGGQGGVLVDHQGGGAGHRRGGARGPPEPFALGARSHLGRGPRAGGGEVGLHGGTVDGGPTRGGRRDRTGDGQGMGGVEGERHPSGGDGGPQGAPWSWLVDSVGIGVPPP